MVELYSELINKIPFPTKIKRVFNKHLLLEDNSGISYYLLFLNDKEYQVLYDVSRSEYFENPIYEFSINEGNYLLYKAYLNKSEEKLCLEKILDLELKVFNDFKANTSLSHNAGKSLDNLFKVLDSRFMYLELRMREIELKPIKNDFDWIVLAKYHVILDSRIFIYDLQNDLFKELEKTFDEPLGLVIRKGYPIIDIKDRIIAIPDVYKGLLSNLFARYYVNYDHYNISDIVKKRLDKESKFIKKYFFFLVLYIYILDLDITNNQVEFNTHLFVQITKKIEDVLKAFSSYAK